MSINITAIKNIFQPGTMVPMKQQGGNIGQWVEYILMCRGFPVNNGKGPDLPNNLEIKTRNVDAISPYTIGSMKSAEIIRTPWDLSIVRNKSQRWFFVVFSDDLSIVLDSYMLDLRDPFIQKSLETEYEWGREQFRNGNRQDVIRRDPTDRYAYWEKKNDSPNSWQFRVPDETLWSWTNIQNNAPIFSTLFY